MKKQFYLLTAGLLLVCLAHAQLKEGDVLVGGNVNFVITNSTPGGTSDHAKQTNFALMPSIGKVMKDGLLVGLNLTYSHYRYNSGGTVALINYTDTYGLGVFARKYKTLGSGFALFGEGDLSGQYAISNSYSDANPKPPVGKSYAITAGFYPGIAYFISRHVQLETGIQNLAYATFSHINSGGGTGFSKSNDLGIGTNFNQLLQNFVVGIKWVI